MSTRIGRYRVQSAWAYGRMLTLFKGRPESNVTPWRDWWFGDDQISASDEYSSGLFVLKVWDGTQWKPVNNLKVHNF